MLGAAPNVLSQVGGLDGKGSQLLVRPPCLAVRCSDVVVTRSCARSPVSQLSRAIGVLPTAEGRWVQRHPGSWAPCGDTGDARALCPLLPLPGPMAGRDEAAE